MIRISSGREWQKLKGADEGLIFGRVCMFGDLWGFLCLPFI
jgi:hypothetical protein